VLVFLKLSSGTLASLVVLFSTGDDDVDEPTTVKEEVPPP
jgi:hypothetical protein